MGFAAPPQKSMKVSLCNEGEMSWGDSCLTILEMGNGAQNRNEQQPSAFLSLPAQHLSWYTTCCAQGEGLEMFLSTQALERAQFSSLCSSLGREGTCGLLALLGSRESRMDFGIPCSKTSTFIYKTPRLTLR